MGSKKNVLVGFIVHPLGKFLSEVEIEFVEECLSELGKAIRVDLFLLLNDGQRDLRE